MSMRESQSISEEKLRLAADNTVNLQKIRGFTQEDMASYLGITRQTYARRFLHYPREITLGNLADAARKLNTTMDQLLFGRMTLSKN